METPFSGKPTGQDWQSYCQPFLSTGMAYLLHLVGFASLCQHWAVFSLSALHVLRFCYSLDLEFPTGSHGIWWSVGNGQTWGMCTWAGIWILDCRCLSFASFVELILSFLYLCSGDWTKVARVIHQVPLAIEPCCWHFKRKCLFILGILGNCISAYNTGLTWMTVPGF